jgi:N6-adenosine-specific RNA methylase IME4
MFKTIVADPPWKKANGGVGHASLQCSTHYDVQTTEQIINTLSTWMSEYEVAPESHLYMWTVNSFSAGKHQGIIPSLEVCERLGYKPITMIPWIKSNIGSPTPYGMRYTEMCIFAVKYDKGMGKRTRYSGTNEIESVANGKGLCASKDYINAPRREHSRKPSEFYDWVESRSKGPYLDLYSRTSRPGWTGLGYEAGKWTTQVQQK